MRLTDDGMTLVGAMSARAVDRPADGGGLVDRVAAMTVVEIRQAVVAGEMTAAQVVAAEAAGRRRMSVLAMG